jgi:hypothetical protein
VKIKKVEFYFILYLAAIISLFTIARERDEKENTLIEVYKQLIELVKGGNIFNYAMTMPKSIYYNLDKDTFALNYEIKIIGQVENPKVTILPHPESKKVGTDEIFDIYDKFVYSKDSSSVRFNWKPYRPDEGFYQIVFKAQATTLLSKKLDSIIETLPEDIKAQLRETIVKKDTMSIWVYTETKGPQMVIPPFKLTARLYYVPTLRFPNKPARWSNQIIVSGVDVMHQLSEPQILPPGIATITSKSPTEFIVSGESREKGVKSVTVSAYNTFGQVDRTVFTVEVLDPDLEDNDRQAIVGEEYLFRGNIQNAPGMIINIVANFEGQEVARGINTLKLVTTSEGKLVFKRYLENEDINLDFTVRVIPPPPPTITKFQLEGIGDERWIAATTISYGKDKTGKPNYAKLRFRTGADYVGEPTPDGSPISMGGQHRQNWKISMSIPENVPQIALKVYAIDTRGGISEDRDMTVAVTKEQKK